MRVELSSLLPPAQLLRPVDLDGIDMTLLIDSIRKSGQLIVPITVCGRVIVDGYRRWLACKSLGWEEVDVHEIEGDPGELRIIAQTRHTVFGRDEKRALVGDCLAKNRETTAAGLAQTFQWTPAEVESLAGVEFLIPDYERAYRDGRVTLAEVWHLSRVRDEGQLQLLEDSDESLYDRASAMHREVRTARRRSMVTRSRGKTYNAIVREQECPTEAGLALIKCKAETPMDGWLACLNWIVGSESK